MQSARHIPSLAAGASWGEREKKDGNAAAQATGKRGLGRSPMTNVKPVDIPARAYRDRRDKNLLDGHYSARLCKHKVWFSLLKREKALDLADDIALEHVRASVFFTERAENVGAPQHSLWRNFCMEASTRVNRGVAMKALLLGSLAALAVIDAALASGGIDNTPGIPEPSTIALLAAGGVALIWARTRHRRRK